MVIVSFDKYIFKIEVNIFMNPSYYNRVIVLYKYFKFT